MDERDVIKERIDYISKSDTILYSTINEDIKLSGLTIICCVYCIAVFIFYMIITPYFMKVEIDNASLFSKIIVRVIPVYFILLMVYILKVLKLTKLRKLLKDENKNRETVQT
ncbi:hypothetical protein CLNEO_25230 [Anaerotignum neopropionicum]|uniref:Uncharacterized protein n=1 Tax=Anaerotignum neopropionicum TaxID=36847 RepID=A0A136WCE2_9FIRM|nr:hypothetical protein [Anaerotignum neopropionicum]KXL52174.1 hypothetical protein CLNEO_25230 [Anaerotignum neopropionicum]